MRPLSQRLINNLRNPLRVWNWLQYQNSRPAESDTLLITLNSAGTHWVRTMLAQALIEAFQLEDRITTIQQPDIIPTFSDKTARFKYNDNSAIPRIQHAHAAYSPLFGKRRVLLLVRDLRDAIVSHHKIHTRAANPDISFSDFLRGNGVRRKRHHTLQTRISFLNSWWSHREHFPAFETLRFEDMKAHPQETLARAMRFAGIPNLSPEKLAGVLDFCSIENMKKWRRRIPIRDLKRRYPRSGRESRADTRNISARKTATGSCKSSAASCGMISDTTIRSGSYNFLCAPNSALSAHPPQK